MPDRPASDEPSEPRRTALVTGANTGIGRVTAHELARAGFRVILACRSASKTTPVIDAIVADTGNHDVEFLPLDLADLTSVRAAADVLIARGDPLHVLVANAGVAGQRGTTAQGFELAFGINHLGHFLFVTDLLALLEAGAAPGDPSRIVIVSSDSHFQAKGIDLDAVQRSTPGVTGLREYAVSKLANVAFAQELERRLDPDVWVCAVHPGVIASDVWRNVPWPVRPIMTRFMRSTDQGASTSLMCATSDEVTSSGVGYWSEGEPKDPNPAATPELAAELWSRSEEWVAPYRP